MYLHHSAHLHFSIANNITDCGVGRVKTNGCSVGMFYVCFLRFPGSFPWVFHILFILPLTFILCTSLSLFRFSPCLWWWIDELALWLILLCCFLSFLFPCAFLRHTTQNKKNVSNNGTILYLFCCRCMPNNYFYTDVLTIGFCLNWNIQSPFSHHWFSFSTFSISTTSVPDWMSTPATLTRHSLSWSLQKALLITNALVRLRS